MVKRTVLVSRPRSVVIAVATFVVIALGLLGFATTGAQAGSYDYDRAAAGGVSLPMISMVIDGPSSVWITPTSIERALHGALQRFRVAAEAGGGAVRTVAALTREQDAALRAVMRNPNDLEHIFGQGGKHNLGQLVKELGGQEAVVREAILRIPRGQAEGVFKLPIGIGPHSVVVTGRMMNGVPRVSNMWMVP